MENFDAYFQVLISLLENITSCVLRYRTNLFANHLSSSKLSEMPDSIKCRLLFIELELISRNVGTRETRRIHGSTLKHSRGRRKAKGLANLEGTLDFLSLTVLICRLIPQ